MSHTIAAVSTGNQVSAIGIIRLTGDDCIAVADKVFTLNNQKTLAQIPDRKLMLGELHDKDGRVIDQCKEGDLSSHSAANSANQNLHRISFLHSSEYPIRA